MSYGAFNAKRHYTVSASGTAANTTIREGESVIRIVNTSGQILFWRADLTAIAATTSDCAVAVGATEVFALSPNARNVSIILAASTGTVYFDIGWGI